MLQRTFGLSPSALEAIAQLEQQVVEADGGRLKVEWGTLRTRSGDDVEDLLWWDGDRLAGFVGLYSFGPSVELSGMVAPAARRRGFATALLEAGLGLCHDRGHKQVLVVVPRPSIGGKALAIGHRGVLDHSEHALVLLTEPSEGSSDPRIGLRRAGPDDAVAVGRLLEVGFGHPAPDLATLLGSDQGPTLLIELDGQPVGTIRHTRNGDDAGVYGFVVDPAHQGRGVGRQVLRQVCQDLFHAGARRVGLEVEVDAVEAADPGAVSACDGWTTHEIVAHVTGIAVEVARHLDPYLQGDPVPETRTFEDREAPLEALPHNELLHQLDAEETRMRTLVADVLAQEPEAVIPWTGRRMAMAKFIPHLRNEHALHRWDVVGDDQVSTTLLGQNDLTEHSVEVLGRILLVAGRAHDPDPDADFDVCLHSEGELDLSVVVRHGEATLTWAGPASDPPFLVCDPAARHLFIWGRRPAGRGRLISHLEPIQLARLQVLLSGY